MKKWIITVALFAGITPLATAQMENIPPAVAGQVYGDKVKEKGAKDIAQLPGMLEGKEGKVNARVTAKVIDVCPKKGCWMNLYINDSTTAFVKMKDYGFFVPKDIAGKEIVIEGDAYVEETSVEELRHYALDAKKPQAEIDAITEPEKSIRITAKGIKVLD